MRRESHRRDVLIQIHGCDSPWHFWLTHQSVDMSRLSLLASTTFRAAMAIYIDSHPTAIEGQIQVKQPKRFLALSGWVMIICKLRVSVENFSEDCMEPGNAQGGSQFSDQTWLESLLSISTGRMVINKGLYNICQGLHFKSHLRAMKTWSDDCSEREARLNVALKIIWENLLG